MILLSYFSFKSSSWNITNSIQFFSWLPLFRFKPLKFWLHDITSSNSLTSEMDIHLYFKGREMDQSTVQKWCVYGHFASYTHACMTLSNWQPCNTNGIYDYPCSVSLVNFCTKSSLFYTTICINLTRLYWCWKGIFTSANYKLKNLNNFPLTFLTDSQFTVDTYDDMTSNWPLQFEKHFHNWINVILRNKKQMYHFNKLLKYPTGLSNNTLRNTMNCRLSKNPVSPNLSIINTVPL